MSLAGVRSFRGDAYQVQVALDKIIALLLDADVLSVQVESLGVVGQAPPSVDDIVVEMEDRTVYIQAKKNQPKRREWSLRDEDLRVELVKARDQLERDPRGEAWFYSRSSFGELEQLCEEARFFPDYDAFNKEAPATLKTALTRFAEAVTCGPPEAFALVRRVQTKQTPSFDDWERSIRRELRFRYARPDDVLDMLVGMIYRQQARLGGGPLVDPGAPITRADLYDLLRTRGHIQVPDRPEAEMLAAFARASRHGRTWKRDVDGHRFTRPEMDEIVSALSEGARSLVITSGPGGGKTCVLLDLVDRLEKADEWAVLFIKGDLYSGARTRSDLADRGLPDDIAGLASRLAVKRRVVVVVDALDVLSLQRASGTLNLFLGLIDELAAVEGVAVVAACRDFDLAYSPALRDRIWDRRVNVGPLPVGTVNDVLCGWGVAPETIRDELRDQLRVPQHLWLYGQLVAGGVTNVSAGPYALHDRFLDVVVEEAHGLGERAMTALYETADRLQERRRLEMSRTSFPGDPVLLEGLLSAEVLIEPRVGSIAFSHQELLDCVAVRGAERRGETLLAFLAGRPALPFLRPTARTFLFMLRARDPEAFRKQIRGALDNEGLAYHLRRLIAESLAEVEPETEDRRLIRFLMRKHPDLFERFANRLRDKAWLDHILVLLDDVRQSADAERWTSRLLTLLRVWISEAPDVVLGAWRDALQNRWTGLNDALWEGSQVVREALKSTKEGKTPPAVTGEVIRLLFNLPDPDGWRGYGLEEMVRAWVTAIDGDDDLVIKVLERENQADRRDHTSPEFKGEFLEERLWASDEVMNWVYAELVRRISDEEAQLSRWSDLLNATSYQGRHSRGMMVGDDLNTLALPFERALVRRAERGDAWWQTHHSQMREHDDLGMLYLAMMGYRASPERHAREIAEIVSNPEVLGRWSLASEIRELAHAAYPYFTDDEREAHQQALLTLYEAADEENVGRARAIYERLLWVPRPWRSPKTVAFVEAWEQRFDSIRPEAEITSNGGMVPPPFSSDQLLSLSEEDAIRLALFFGTEGHGGTDGWGYPLGGWDQAVGQFREAASRAPDRMRALLPKMIEAGVAPPYLDAVVAGLGLYLRYRFDNTTMSGWTAVEEHEDGEPLGRALLQLIERFGDKGLRPGYSQSPSWKEPGAPWLSENTVGDAIQGCQAVLTDSDDLARLTLVLVRLGQSEDPGPDRMGDSPIVALNSIRGEVASTATFVAGRALAEGASLPPLLRSLLFQLASDPIDGVRWSVIRALPYLTQFDLALGWELAEHALVGREPELWAVAEQLLYHNYYQHFDRVAPYLAVLRESGIAPEAYGRIGMLSGLAGHLNAKTFIKELAGLPDGAWKGAAQVLTANLASERSRAVCVAELPGFISIAPPAAVSTVAHGLIDKIRPYAPRDVILQLIHQRNDEDGFRWTQIAEWIELEAARDPESAAGVLEQLAEAVARSTGRGVYVPNDKLERALTAILRDADESDNADFIRTAVALQDTLTRRGLINADALFDAAARQ